MLSLLRSILSSNEEKSNGKAPVLKNGSERAARKALIVSDHPSKAVKARSILLERGFDCPTQATVTLAKARASARDFEADILLFFLSPEPQKSLPVLTELREVTPARIFAIGPTEDSRMILRTLRLGADEYLDESETESELQSVLASRRSGCQVAGAGGKVIAVLSPSGGCGASTVAANLGIALAQQHERSLLIDLNLAQGDLAALLDLKPGFTLADLCQRSRRVDRSMVERSLAQHESGAQLMASPREWCSSTEPFLEGARQALDWGRALFPYVVVDLDRSFQPEQVLALRQADQVLLLLRLDFTSLRNTHHVLQHLRRLELKSEQIDVIVNRYGQPKELDIARAEEVLGLKIKHRIPDEPKVMNRAINHGAPAILEQPKSRMAKSLFELTKRVVEAVSDHQG